MYFIRSARIGLLSLDMTWLDTGCRDDMHCTEPRHVKTKLTEFLSDASLGPTQVGNKDIVISYVTSIVILGS